MRQSPRLLGLLSLALLLTCLRAEPAKGEAEKMTTREFKVSPRFIHLHFDGRPQPAGTTVPLIKSAQEVLGEQGITFPEGASCSFDVFASTLSVTNTQGNQELVEAFFEQIHRQALHQLVFGLTVVEGPGQTIRQLNAEASRSPDAAPALAALLKDTGVRVVGESVLTTASGTRATTRSGQEHRFPSGFDLNAQGRLSAGQEIFTTGLNLELKPSIQHLDKTIELTGSLELNPEPASDRQTWFSMSGTDKKVSLPMPGKAALRSTFNTSLRHGETRLVGIAAPPRVIRQGGSDILWASFLTVHKVRTDEPPLVMAATPASPMKAPAGMQAAAFLVPTGMLENAMAEGQTLQQFFETHGIPAAAGAEASVEGEVLSAVNTAANMERMAVLIHHMSSALPRTVALTLHAVQGGGPYLRSLAAQAAPLADHGKLWAEIEQGAAAGKHALKITNTARIDFQQDAKRAGLTSAREHRHLASYDEGKKTKKVLPGFEVHEIGTTLAFSAESHTTGLTGITLNVTTHSQPTQTQEQPATGGVNKQALPPVTDVQMQETSTSVSFPDGGTRLISLTRPHGLAGEDTVFATFLRCDVSAQSAKPQPVPRRPAPPRPPNSNAESKEQYTRSYRVPPDFLSTSVTDQAEDLADPFKPGTGEAGLATRKSAKEILEAAGIPFPPGASVHSGGATSQLVVRNTQENLDKVEAYIQEIIEEMRPLPVVLTTHIIEAPGPVVRQIMAGMGGRNNHRSELEQLLKLAGEGKATALATSRIETKSGTRAMDESGVKHNHLSDATPDDQGGVSFATDERLVGLRNKVEMVLHKRHGLTAQSTMAIEFHTAPPVTHDEQVANAEGRLMTFPLTDFHVMKLATETIIPDGTARLLAVWKPEGKKGGEAGDVLQAAFVTCDVLRPTK